MAKKPPRTKNRDNARRSKKKVSVLASESVDYIDYKDVNLLRRFMSDRGKIRARRVTGNCAQHQREVAVAIKTARELALLPYTQRSTAERGLGRGRREGPIGPSPDVAGAEADEAIAADLEGVGDDEEAVEVALDGAPGADGADGADAGELVSASGRIDEDAGGDET